MKHNRVISIISIVALAALIIMLNFTSPTEIGPFGVLLFFTTLYVVVFGVMTLIWQVFRGMAFGKHKLRTKDYIYTMVAAFGPILVLMARNFDTLNLWTSGLIGFILILAEFLVYKKY